MNHNDDVEILNAVRTALYDQEKPSFQQQRGKSNNESALLHAIRSNIETGITREGDKAEEEENYSENGEDNLGDQNFIQRKYSNPVTNYTPRIPQQSSTTSKVLFHTPSSSTPGSDVFNRLYERSKLSSSCKVPNQFDFTPRINAKSRELAESHGSRSSLYERAVQSRSRKESAREYTVSLEKEDRNRSKLSASSQELAWNRLRREIENAFFQVLHSSDPNAEVETINLEQELNADSTSFEQILVLLHLNDGFEDFFEQLQENGNINVNSFCDFIYQLEYNDQFVQGNPRFKKLKLLLISRKAIPSTASIERVSREMLEETPFSPQISKMASKLDEKRNLKLGIDPSLPRSEKIHLETKVLFQKREEVRNRHLREELAECTFHPRVTTSSTPTKITKKPVSDRLYDDSKERKARLELKKSAKQNQIEREIQDNCTFNPKINQTLSKVSNSSSLQDRQAKSFQRSVERLKNWREKHEDRIDELDIKNQPQMKHTPPSAPRRKRDPNVISNPSSSSILEVQVNLPNGEIKSIKIKPGDDLEMITALFARKYGLDEQTEGKLLHHLQTDLSSSVSEASQSPRPPPPPPMESEEESESFQEQTSNEVEDATNTYFIDILVRKGETYTLKFSPETQDPAEVANSFAKQVKMEKAAKEQLVESLVLLAQQFFQKNQAGEYE